MKLKTRLKLNPTIDSKEIQMQITIKQTLKFSYIKKKKITQGSKRQASTAKYNNFYIANTKTNNV
jgi:hypothetical protein